MSSPDHAVATDDLDTLAAAAGLRHGSDDEPGIVRRRRGRGYSYVSPDGEPLQGAARERIEALAIPPAWTDVWISVDPDSHLLATGRDHEGRKQYRYHDRWREIRDEQKFDLLSSFADVLPEIRKAVKADLGASTLTENRVTAAVVRLLDTTLIRVGNESYAEDNDTFGATTLEPAHVRLRDFGHELRFDGKGGERRQIDVSDTAVNRVIDACLEHRQSQLFWFEARSGGDVVDVTSEHVNSYLDRLAGDAATAKTFRTWGGTVTAAAVLGHRDRAVDDVEVHRLDAIDAAAEALGNTRAVCRSCYVAPVVLKRLDDGGFDDAWRSSREGRWRSRAESATTKLLA